MSQLPRSDTWKQSSFGKEFVEIIKKYVEEKEIIRPLDMVVKSVVNKSGIKVYIIQSIRGWSIGCLPVHLRWSHVNCGNPNTSFSLPLWDGAIVSTARHLSAYDTEYTPLFQWALRTLSDTPREDCGSSSRRALSVHGYCRATKPLCPLCDS